MSNLTRFIGHLRNGLARPNRYEVFFTLPRGVLDVTAVVSRSVNYKSMMGMITAQDFRMNEDGRIGLFCHTCSLPMRSLATFEHKTHMGPAYKAPYSSSYEPVTFTFYADKGMNTRRYFDIWQQSVLNVYSNTNNYMNEFTSDVTIVTLDQEGKPGYRTTLYEAFPVNVGAVDLSYSQNNALTNVSVTLSYKIWESDV